MRATDSLRKQHVELTKLIDKMSLLLVPERLAVDAQTMRQLLHTLFGKLTVHLAMEDRSMYPLLLNHPDVTLQKTAEHYQREMGGHAEAFTKYVKTWTVGGAIEANAPLFVAETRKIFAVLSNRIRREDSELYVLADAAER